MFGWLRRAPSAPARDRLRVTQAIVSYPPYAPPKWEPDPDFESMRAASARYREYFLGSFPVRLAALSALLASFDVSSSLDDAGLMAVSAWLPQWGDLLIDDFRDETVRNAYRRLEVPWTGTLSGLNVIFDLAIYYGECLWARRRKLEWMVARGPDSALHAVKGLPGGKPFDPFNFMYLECQNIRAAKIGRQKRLPHSGDPVFLKPDCFYRHVLGNAPPGRRSRKGAP